MSILSIQDVLSQFMSICHISGGSGNPNPYLLASVGTKEAVFLVIRYSVSIDGHTNLEAIQGMQAYEDGGQVNLKVHNYNKTDN